MPLVLKTEKKLAANRGNAQKSTGPRTAEGEVRTARNACQHHLYAHTDVIPPEWEAHIVPPDPRCHRARCIYPGPWSIELETLAGDYFRHTLDLCHNGFHPVVKQRFVPNSLLTRHPQLPLHVLSKSTEPFMTAGAISAPSLTFLPEPSTHASRLSPPDPEPRKLLPASIIPISLSLHNHLLQPPEFTALTHTRPTSARASYAGVSYPERDGRLAQLVRASGLHPEGRGIVTLSAHHAPSPHPQRDPRRHTVQIERPPLRHNRPLR